MSREYRYFIIDVFTERRFGGNPLAVLPDARGLSDAEMQQIAAEFNFSESTFVLPPEDTANTRRVRIFTPKQELPFAGHPNVGTAFALAAADLVPWQGAALGLRFEEGAGIVPIEVRRDGEQIICRLQAPQPLRFLDQMTTKDAAALAGLDAGDIVSIRHEPVLASVGVPFLFAEVANVAALARARPHGPAFESLLPATRAAGIHLYTRVTEESFDVRARMFGPMLGVPEDPATGAANCALAGLLVSLETADGEYAWRIGQGIEMGRPSLIRAGAARLDGVPQLAWLEGASVLVADGSLYI